MEKLECVVQDYAWGDPESIPALLGRPATGEPQAEMWMGAHPKAPSTLDGQSLTDVIAADPTAVLGADIADRFGQLPFLFKVLAAGQPLSVQAHPSLEQARVGFAREDALGIDIGAPERTYRDANHKPELICAITPFVGKCGFRPLAEARDLFATLQIETMVERLAIGGADSTDADVHAATLAWLLRLTTDESTALVQSVVASAAATSSDVFADELEWTGIINGFFPDDIGVVVVLLLNHIVLEPGDAVFLDAGNLHAYLRGTGMELMANSDNVVRGGCTPKNIDVEELLSVVDCTPTDPPVQRASGKKHTFDSPVDEFSLTRYQLSADAEKVEPISAEIIIVESGTATLETMETLATPSQALTLEQGEVGFVSASDGAYILSGTGTTFRASVGRS